MAQSLPPREAYPKVLVAVPTYEGKDYVFPQCYECILKLTYPNFDFIVYDNSESVDYYLKLKRKGFKNIHHLPRLENSRETLSHTQNVARQKAIDENYDYLLFIESDLLPPENAIEQLIQHNKPVVGSVYYIGTGEIKLPCIFFKEFKHDLMTMGTRLIKPQEVDDYLYKGLKRVHGVGLGCTLIRRDVFSRYIFWHDLRFDNKHSDVYFYMELDNDGVPVFVDTNQVIIHIPSKWEEVKDR